MSESKVVVSRPVRRHVTKRQLLVGVTVFVVLLAAGAAWYWLQHHRTSQAGGPVPQYSGQTLVDEVNKKYGQQDYAGVIALLKGQKNASTDTQLMLANAYAMQKDFTNALAIYAALDKANQLPGSGAAAAGAIAEQSGDNKSALHYYQLAAQKAKDNKQPANDDEAVMYQAKVEELQQKQ